MKSIDKIMQTQNDYLKSYIQSDVETLKDILDDDWTLITANGRVSNKNLQLDYLRSGSLKVEEAYDENLTIKEHDSTAIIYGRRRSKVLYKGVDLSNCTRFTHIYIKKNEIWKCCLSTVTPVSIPPINLENT